MIDERVTQAQLYRSQAEQDDRWHDRLERLPSRREMWTSTVIVGVVASAGSFFGAKYQLQQPAQVALSALRHIVF